MISQLLHTGIWKMNSPHKKKKIYQRLQIQLQLRITAKSYSYNLLLIVTLKTCLQNEFLTIVSPLKAF